MDYAKAFAGALLALKNEGRYRVFADIRRERGSFPAARHFTAARVEPEVRHLEHGRRDRLGAAAERQQDLKERAEHTFESFICTEYRSWGKAHLRDYVLAEGRLKGCFGDLYPKKLDQITQWSVEKCRSVRLRGGSRP